MPWEPGISSVREQEEGWGGSPSQPPPPPAALLLLERSQGDFISHPTAKLFDCRVLRESTRTSEAGPGPSHHLPKVIEWKGLITHNFLGVLHWTKTAYHH